MAKIMCIDDDKDILEALKMTLKTAGHTIETASSGKEGFTKAQAFKPDLIILDVMMDDLTDGFHTAYAIRKDAALQYKPILMLTSVNQETGLGFDRERDGKFLPVDEFLPKPITPRKLLEVTTNLLKLKKEEININGKNESMY